MDFRKFEMVENKGLFEGASKYFSNENWVFWVGIWVIEGNGREIENWVVGESGTHSPSGSQGGFSGNVKYPPGYKGYLQLHIVQKCKIFLIKKLACLG